MAKDITLQFTLKQEQVGLGFMRKVTKALLAAGVIKSEDQVHLIGATHTFIVPKPPPGVSG